MATHSRPISAITVLTFAALTLLTLISTHARAAGPWYVAPGGSDGNPCLSTGSPCATINGAIGKATAGDTIYVATGTYTSTTGNEVVLIDKDVTLSGGWDSAFATQSGASTIDGQEARRGVTVNSDVTASVEHFVTQNGLAGDGGGIKNSGTLTLNNSNVSSNMASEPNPYGGGISNIGTLNLNNSTVNGNTVPISYTNGGKGGGIYNNSGTMTLINSTVSGNTFSNSNFPPLNHGNGGGIYNNSGTVTLINSAVSSNTTIPMLGTGGGIFNNSGNMTLNNSTVSGNNTFMPISGVIINTSGGNLTLTNSTISSNGGGIVNGGTLILNNSTVSSNTSQSFIIYNSIGTVTLTDSTISSNGGGGIFNGGMMALTNSTVSGNTAYVVGGGGILNNSGTLTLNNSTVSDNNTSDGDGGGIFNYDGTVTLQNSILAGNMASGAGPDCSGTINGAGYNLIGNTTDCTITGDTTGNMTGINPLLSPLQDNGGPTLTHALLPGSPAIDAGNPAGCTDNLGNPLNTDQRGVDRVGRCDIGAYEYVPYIFLPLILK